MEQRYLFLKTECGELIKQEKFGSDDFKRKIIEKWKKLYGKRFEKLIIEEQAPVAKEKYSPVKGQKVSFGVLTSSHRRKNTSKNFNRSWNGYKD